MFEDIVKTLNLISRVSELAANEYVLECWSADDGNTSVYWESLKKKESILLGCVPALLFFSFITFYSFFFTWAFFGGKLKHNKVGSVLVANPNCVPYSAWHGNRICVVLFTSE